MSEEYENTTVGVPVFMRVESTKYCLESAYEYGFRKFVIADDGKMTEEKKRMYKDFNRKVDHFNLINMDYDVGVSKKRNRIVDEIDTEYLLLMDSDNTLINVEHAYEVLRRNKNIGGVSGFVIEPDRLKLVASKLNEINKGKYIVKDSRDVDYNREYNVYICDFIPHCGLFRMDIFEESKWDEHFKVGYDHFDFFLSFKDTDWMFASSPVVAFEHNMMDDSVSAWGDESDRLESARSYFLDKWRYEDLLVVRAGVVDSSCELRNRIIEMFYDYFPFKITKLIDKVI